MKTLVFALVILVLGANSCSPQPEKAPATLRYWLPVQDLSAKKASVERWGLAAPIIGEFSDPNAIVYDQAYIDAYVNWAIDTPIACGPATYWITTSEKVLEINSGLDEADLGRRFRADDLIAFLKTRVDGKIIERTFKINRPDAAEMLREQPESQVARRLGQSPWDRHTEMVAYLLSLAQYKPAYPLLKSLVTDRSPGVRYAAVIGLGRLSVVVPEAVPELARLLPDKKLGADAATALTFAGAAAVPVFIEAMDHPDDIVRNRAVYGLRGLDLEVGLPGLLAALEHKDTTIRKWGLSVVIDMQGRKVEVGKDALVDTLGKRLLDGDDEIRRSAVIALFNLKEAAARARPALLKAAAGDPDQKTRDYAQQTLEAIGPGANEPKDSPVPHFAFLNLRTCPARCVAMSPDGTTVALGDASHYGVEIALWDFESGALKRVLAGHAPGKRSSFYVQSLAFAPDGKTLASGGGAAEEHGEVLLWDMDTGQIKQRLQAGKHYVQSIAFSPDGRTLGAFTIGDASVRFYETGTGKLLRELKLTGSPFPTHVAFARDLRLAASGDRSGGRIQLWETDTGRLRHSFQSNDNGSIYSFILSPDGKMLAAHGGHLWDLASGKVLNKLRGLEDTNGVWEFSPDSRMLAFPCKKGGIALWDVATGKVIRELSGERSVHGMTFTPNGGNLVTSNGLVWDVQTGTLERGLAARGLEFGQAIFSRDGKTLVTRHDSHTWFDKPRTPIHSEVRLWDARSGAMRHLLGSKRFQISDFALTADASTLATWGEDNKVRFWDVKTGELQRTLESTISDAHAALSPDGTSLVIRGAMIDAKTGRKLHHLHGDVAAFSLDGTQIATAGHWEVNIWNAASGELVRQLFRDESKKRDPYNGETIDGLRFSPDGKSLAVLVSINGGMTPLGRLEVWDVVSTPLPAKPVRVHGGLHWRRYWPDPRYVFVDSLDIWSVKPSRREPGDFEGRQMRPMPPGRVFAFSPDGKNIVTGDSGPEVKVWDAMTLKQWATLLPLPIVDEKSPWTDWVTHTPNGFFIGSANSPFMQWRVGDQLLPVEQFDLARRRPDLVEKALRGEEITPIFDPEDSRIRGFIDFLQKTGMKLEHDAPSKLWRILDPKFPGGIVRVGFSSFTQSATEAQMRDALSESRWGWRHFNVPARLAMTTIVTEGFKKGKPDEIVLLEQGLRHAFFWHQRELTFPLKNELSNEVMNAGLNAKDKRILALVAYLGRNGIKLVVDKEVAGWRIVEPKHDDGFLTVSIRSFPPSASEEQIRFALANVNLAYEPNVDAKLGMSHIGTWDSKGAPLPQGLKARLWRLFHDYRPNGVLSGRSSTP